MLSLIVAHDTNRGIGKDNGLPWDLKSEMEHFRLLTIGKPIIMGKNTFESLQRKPLKNRLNIVVTSSDDYAPIQQEHTNLLIVRSLASAVYHANLEKPNTEIMVIGGQQLYEAALPYADRIYATQIELDIEADAYFPEYEKTFERIYASPTQKEKETTFRKTIYERM